MGMCSFCLARKEINEPQTKRKKKEEKIKPIEGYCDPDTEVSQSNSKKKKNEFANQSNLTIYSVMNEEEPQEKTSPSRTESFNKLSSDSYAKEIIPAGLQNLGNTCYMNAILQCLACLPNFDTQLRSSSSNLSKFLLSLILSIKSHKLIQENLRKFKSELNRKCKILDNSLPNDSKYFLSKLLTNLGSEAITKRFLIKTAYSFFCSNCNKNRKQNYDELFLLASASAKISEKEINDKVNRLKEIGMSSDFYCEVCSRVVKSWGNKPRITYPETLIVFLGESTKSSNFEFPLSLSFSGINYSLKAAYNGLPGHATATVRYDREWYYVNDEDVKKVSNPYSKYAVMLFYQKL